MKQLYKNNINNILEELGKELDISKSEHEAAVKSYEAVGKWLSDENSPLNYFNPKILPQGSFMLQTVIKPINEEDDIDIDLVCKLEKKPDSWTQKELKNQIGNRLKENKDYNRMIWEHENGENYEEGGRRCWTLKYSNHAGYHMDILPSFTDDNLSILLEKQFSSGSDLNTDELAIRITDKESDNYPTEKDVNNWLKSNPFGYAKWFYNRAIISSKRLFSLKESIDPVKAYEDEKLPLQRVIQLLKRHRDIMFSNGEFDMEHKPISIIITTLATRAYDKENNIVDAYINIVKNMRSFVEEKVNPDNGKLEKWVSNPVNEEENFADKWAEIMEKQDYFYLWLDKLEEDMGNMLVLEGKGQNESNKFFSNSYGDKVSKKVFSALGENKRLLRESGNLKMETKTGLLGSSGIKVKDHNFFGKVDE
jgi:hypothetical protein